MAYASWRAFLGWGGDVTPFFCAVGLFLLSYLGIAISLLPMIVPGHFTLWQAASTEGTQAFLLIGTLLLLPIILMYTAWSYWVFRGKTQDTYRPGHADFTYDAKYGIRDYRGGGRSSARETAARVAAGAIAHKIITPVVIRGALVQMGPHKIDRANWDWDEVEGIFFLIAPVPAANRA